MYVLRFTKGMKTTLFSHLFMSIMCVDLKIRHRVSRRGLYDMEKVFKTLGKIDEEVSTVNR